MEFITELNTRQETGWTWSVWLFVSLARRDLLLAARELSKSCVISRRIPDRIEFWAKAVTESAWSESNPY